MSGMESRAIGSMIVERITGSETGRRVIRFGVAGLLSTAFYFVVANLIVLVLAMKPVWASVCAYLLAIAFSYAVQSRFTFRVKQDTAAQVIKFVVTSVAGLGVSFSAVWFFSDILSLPFWVGTAAVCLIIPAMNFLVFNRWVFADNRRERSV